MQNMLSYWVMDELARGEAIIRFMETSEQETIPLDIVSERITSLVKG